MLPLLAAPRMAMAQLVWVPGPFNNATITCSTREMLDEPPELPPQWLPGTPVFYADNGAVVALWGRLAFPGNFGAGADLLSIGSYLPLDNPNRSVVSTSSPISPTQFVFLIQPLPFPPEIPKFGPGGAAVIVNPLLGARMLARFLNDQVDQNGENNGSVIDISVDATYQNILPFDQPYIFSHGTGMSGTLGVATPFTKAADYVAISITTHIDSISASRNIGYVNAVILATRGAGTGNSIVVGDSSSDPVDHLVNHNGNNFTAWAASASNFLIFSGETVRVKTRMTMLVDPDAVLNLTDLPPGEGGGLGGGVDTTFMQADFNDDFAIDGHDVPQFVFALIDGSDPDEVKKADMNHDGVANTSDLPQFVESLLRGF